MAPMDGNRRRIDITQQDRGLRPSVLFFVSSDTSNSISSQIFVERVRHRVYNAF